MLAVLCNKVAFMQQLHTYNSINKSICDFEKSEPGNFSETQKFATTKLNRLTLSRTTLHTYRASFGVLAAAQEETSLEGREGLRGALSPPHLNGFGGYRKRQQRKKIYFSEWELFLKMQVVKH